MKKTPEQLIDRKMIARERALVAPDLEQGGIFCDIAESLVIAALSSMRIRLGEPVPGEGRQWVNCVHRYLPFRPDGFTARHTLMTLEKLEQKGKVERVDGSRDIWPQWKLVHPSGSGAGKPDHKCSIGDLVDICTMSELGFLCNVCGRVFRSIKAQTP